MIAAQEVGPEDFAYLVPFERFVYKTEGTWNLSEPVGKEGIRHHLLAGGWHLDDIATLLKSRAYTFVYGADLAPREEGIYAAPDGKLYLNTWKPPTLTPAPGPCPRIQCVLDWLCCHDAEAIRWLKAWMAWKVQNPATVPKVAVVCTTEPGGGKGTLAFLMREMLGPANCAVVKREELENKFNSRWVNKLFVLGDEVLTNDNLRDVSSLLKVLIDGDKIELEGKYKDQREVKNRLAWMFASNDRIAPVVLDRGDRRYSVFSNHDPLPAGYAEMLRSCFKIDNVPSDSFLQEMRGFYHELLSLEVDRQLVTTPYENGERALLIDANKSTHELFCEQVDEEGIDGLLDYLLTHGEFYWAKTREAWDFKSEGISTQVLYRCYVEFCKRVGGRPLKINKFGSALHNHRPVWEQTRNTVPGTERRVHCYRVKRGAK